MLLFVLAIEALLLANQQLDLGVRLEHRLTLAGIEVKFFTQSPLGSLLIKYRLKAVTITVSKLPR